MIIILLLILLGMLITKNNQYNENLTQMELENKKAISQNQYLEFSNEKIEKLYKDTLKAIEQEIIELKESHIKSLSEIKKYSPKQVKENLLENIKIENDTSKSSGITQNESKELLIEKRTLQYQLSKSGLDNAKLGAENNKLNSTNYNLNLMLGNKDVQINNLNEAIKIEKKNNKKNLIRFGLIGVGVGTIIGLLL